MNTISASGALSQRHQPNSALSLHALGRAREKHFISGREQECPLLAGQSGGGWAVPAVSVWEQGADSDIRDGLFPAPGRVPAPPQPPRPLPGASLPANHTTVRSPSLPSYAELSPHPLGSCTIAV